MPKGKSPFGHGKWSGSRPRIELLPASPASGDVGVQSSDFTVVFANLVSSVVVTPGSDLSATFTPSSVTGSPGDLTKTFKMTPAVAGAHNLSLTNNAGINNPSPVGYTAGSAEATWSQSIPDIVFAQGTADARSVLPYASNFNASLHEMQLAETSATLPTGVTLAPAGSLVYDGAGQSATVTGIVLDIEDKAPPVYLQLVETDRVSWLNASGSAVTGGLNLSWLNAGGDWRDSNNVQQGTTHYAQANVSFAGGQTQDVSLNVTSLVTALLSNNTGIHMRNPAGWAGYIQTRTGAVPPTLQVITPSGTYNCACLASFWIDASSNASILGTQMTNVMLLRFDLSAVVGTPTSATMTLRTVSVPGGGMTLHVNRLDTPRLYYAPAVEVGGAVQGIANTVAQDTSLAAHASVLCYDDLTSDAKFYGASRRFVTVNLGQPTGEGAAGHYYEALPQYGLTALVVKSGTTGPGIVDVHRWSQPIDVQPEPFAAWRRNYTQGQQLGHTHLFFRYLMWIGEDLYSGFNEGGMKLSSLAGSYDWSTSGAQTLPEPREDAKAHYRSWHSGKSEGAPNFYHFGTYDYDADWTTAAHPGVGRVDMANIVRGACLRAGRWYCLEQELQLNTLTGLGLDDPNGQGIANVNADGIERWWIDGVKVFEYTNRRVRGTPEVNLQSIPYITIYHGGLTPPLAPFTYKLAGVCVASQYIGPPKVIA